MTSLSVVNAGGAEDPDPPAGGGGGAPFVVVVVVVEDIYFTRFVRPSVRPSGALSKNEGRVKRAPQLQPLRALTTLLLRVE